MTHLIHYISAVVEWLLWPVDRLAPAWGLVVASVLTGMITLVAIKYTTPQKRLERCRRALAGAVYEIRVFMDSPRRVAAAQLRLLGNTGLYLLLLLPGMIAASIPLGLLYLHLDMRYGVAPMRAGDPFVVRAELDAKTDGETITAAVTPDGQVTAPILYHRADHSVYVRIRTAAPGAHQVSFRSRDVAVSKTVHVGRADGPLSAVRTRGVAALWSHTAEAPIPAGSPVRAISVVYPERLRSWFHLAWPWWGPWLVIATISALVLRGPMRTTL